jgi:hypothetical protein
LSSNAADFSEQHPHLDVVGDPLPPELPYPIARAIITSAQLIYLRHAQLSYKLSLRLQPSTIIFDL